MKVLVAHASRNGATQAIAKRIAEKLAEAGHEAQARPAKSVTDLAGYQAFVIGSAVCFGNG
jgi:menaquinone-dependent protoporphyrinogen oxidase